MRIITITFLVLISFTNALTTEDRSDSLVAQAWMYWGQNSQQKVEKGFRDAIRANPDNPRAYIGLTFLYEFQRKDVEAWDVFRKIIDLEKNFYPYVFASWYSPKLDPRQGGVKPGLLDFLQKLTQGTEESGTLKAMAWSILGEYYQQLGDLRKTKESFSNMNAINQWAVIGPFQNISASGFDKVFPPEEEFNPTQTYRGKNNVPCKWFKLSATSPSNWIDFQRYFAYTDAIFYANNFVYSPKEQPVQVRIGTSGFLKAFLNDDPLISDLQETNNGLDTYIIEASLQKGWNRFLLKCGYSEISNCNFLMRITDSRGEPLEGLKMETDAQQYRQHPGIQPKLIEIFAESFFKTKIEENPAHIENYILLADCFLKNGKTIQAELILRKAMKLLPDCALLYSRMWQSYRYGQKNDEGLRTREKLYSLDKTYAEALEDKISEALTKEELDTAEELIKELETLVPESEKGFEDLITLYGKRKQQDKLAQLNHNAYAKYPTNIFFAVNEANLSTATTKNYDEAIRIMENYLQHMYTAPALRYLSAYYIYAAQSDKGIETFKKVFDLDPASPGFHAILADVHIARQDYVNAEKAIKSAIAICPNSAPYWAKLGKVYSAKHDEEQSKQCYRLALEYDPTDYDSRDRLREIENKKSVFSSFSVHNTDSLINNAPGNEQYPNDGALILLDDFDRVVYEEGTSEVVQEELVKVFNSKGIDAFKEYEVAYNRYNQKLLIDESVVIKSDGSKFKADINDNLIVFKTLEPNDIIHLKWRIKNYYAGILSHYFWDTNIFNGSFPVRISHYGLIVPVSLQFQYRTINTELAPTVSNTPEGKRYDWVILNDSAIKYEIGMSFTDDAAKTLYVSSIPDWNTIIDWYSDLASTKTRSSYEVEEQVAELMRGKGHISDDDKIKVIYNYIIENIHYSYVPFRQSAFVPQKARDVLVNKIGDCKDLATLGITMLREVGIEAHYVLVNTKDQSQNKNALPSIDFNHCIIAAETKKGLQYLDVTAADYPMHSVPDVDVDAFSLSVNHGSSTPFYLSKINFDPRNIFRYEKITVNKDNSITASQVVSRTGALTASTRSSYRHKNQQQNEKELAEDLSQSYPGVRVNKYAVENADSLEPNLHYSMDYDIPRYVTESGGLKFLKIPWRERLWPNEALSYRERTYPFYYWTGADTLNEAIELILPTGYKPLEIIPNVYYSCPIADYVATYKFSKGILYASRKFIRKESVVPPKGYNEFNRFYENVLKEDERQIVFGSK
jgi:tetratricopeptide (TPR) repeat protein